MYRTYFKTRVLVGARSGHIQAFCTKAKISFILNEVI